MRPLASSTWALLGTRPHPAACLVGLRVPTEDALTAWRENPQEESDPEPEPEPERKQEPETESSSESESEEEEAKPKLKAAKTGEESDSDWPTETESSSESSGGSGDEGFGYTADYFLKTESSTSSKKDRKKKKPKADKPQAQEGELNEEEDDGFFTVTSRRHRQSKKDKPLFGKDDDVTIPSVMDKFYDIIGMRGRKGTSKDDLNKMLVKLRKISDAANLGSAISAKLLINIISTHFDDNKSVAGYMKSPQWAAAHDDIINLLDLLVNEPNLTINREVTEETEVLEVSEEEPTLLVSGDVVNFIERMDDEYTKSLQVIDPHTPAYVSRLRDEIVLYNLILLGEKAIEARNLKSELCRLRMLRLEHVYYKRNYVAVPPRCPGLGEPEKDENGMLVTPAPEKPVEPAEPREPKQWIVNDEEETDISALVKRLCTFLYGRESTDRIRARAMLCNVYHHTLFDRWFEARDLMLMSHLQETIVHSDVPTQILYNRTIVQLGLCAFRAGKIQAAHNALHDIWAGSKPKELLAQGVQNHRWSDKTVEETKIEKRRQTPFHMHINIELLECVYYVCSMLLEMPLIAQQQHDPTKFRMISKPFRRQLDFFCRQPFNGPPENTRDHVMAGALAMLKGEWRTCSDLILNLKVWNLMPDTEAVKATLKASIQEESLRTYLFAYSGYYDSISLITLRYVAVGQLCAGLSGPSLIRLSC